MSQQVSIGQLATAAGVGVETIRYYQRRGLLYQPNKPQGGHRRYAPDMAKRVQFIKRAQRLGFTLTEISGLLRLDEACACAETRKLAGHKLALIEQKIDDLAVIQHVLSDLVRQCDVRGSSACCPIIDALAQKH